MHPSLRFWDVARKAGLAALFVVGEAVTYGWLPNPWDKAGTAIVAVCAYAGVYATKNQPVVRDWAGTFKPPLVDMEALRASQNQLHQERHARKDDSQAAGGRLGGYDQPPPAFPGELPADRAPEGWAKPE